MAKLNFIPIESFIDSSFFQKLSELKLNEYKLDSKPQLVHGKLTDPSKLTKFNNTPTLSLDYHSFDSKKPSDHNIGGLLHNVNTIEEFKSINKLELLKAWSLKLLNDFRNQDYQVKFHILSFSDLKKYKFYYWVAYPILESDWDIIDEADSSIDFKLNENPNNFYKNDDENGNDLQEYVYINNVLDFRICNQLKNYLFLLGYQGISNIKLHVYNPNKPKVFTLKLVDINKSDIKCSGWERTSQGKLGPKLANLSSLINPQQLANQAVDLNLKLMKWRVAPNINLDIIKQQKVLLLGAGTLGSYVSRALLGWGVRDITFVDNGRISYSNPVRQPLFTFNDCFADDGQGLKKAVRASEALREIFPDVNSKGYELEVPMIGHRHTSQEALHKQEKDYNQLTQLIEEHDVIFLLMDSRESRWLPTVIGLSKDKLVINAALGFDSYVVLRHGTIKQDLGCYYCNDVVAPQDSLTDRTLDQMCTVTRPGAALMASSIAVELMASTLQHPEGKDASANETSHLGTVPHQVRGFLHNFEQIKLVAPKYKYCSACSRPVVDNFKQSGWKFIRECLNDSQYLEQICGLSQVQQEAEQLDELLEDLDIDDDMT